MDIAYCDYLYLNYEQRTHQFAISYVAGVTIWLCNIALRNLKVDASVAERRYGTRQGYRVLM